MSFEFYLICFLSPHAEFFLSHEIIRSVYFKGLLLGACYVSSSMFIFGSGFLSPDYKLCYECFLLLFQIIKEFPAKMCRVLILCVLIMMEHRMGFKGVRPY